MTWLCSLQMKAVGLCCVFDSKQSLTELPSLCVRCTLSGFNHTRILRPFNEFIVPLCFAEIRFHRQQLSCLLVSCDGFPLNASPQKVHQPEVSPPLPSGPIIRRGLPEQSEAWLYLRHYHHQLSAGGRKERLWLLGAAARGVDRLH